MDTITYVGGCGRLGLALAAWSAQVGYRVLCADVNQTAIDTVNAGRSPHYEPEVGNLIARWHGQRLRATTDTTTAIRQSSLSVVVVPTPSRGDGSFSLDYVLAACQDIGAGLRDRPDYHVVIIASTVNPGDTAGPIRAVLEEASGLPAGRDWGLIYSPEFVRQGSIVHDFAHPSQVLIGELDSPSGDAAEAYYCRIVDNGSPVHRMSLTSAEVAKIGLNTTIVIKMAVANQLAWLCHAIPGTDAGDVLEAIGSDVRIGHKYFSAGLADGGPCLPRDGRALVAAADQWGTSVPIAEAADDFREEQLDRLVNLVLREAQGRPIGILGLTYKPGTDIVEESPALRLAGDLYRFGAATVWAYDPVIDQPTISFRTTLSLENLLEHAQVLVIATCWPEFKRLEHTPLPGKTIIDPWGFLDEEQLDCAKYVRLGRGT